MVMRFSRWAQALAILAWTFGISLGQESVKPAAAGQVIPVAASSAKAEALLEGDIASWKQAQVKRVSLNRTPPLYDTDKSAANEIPVVEVRTLRGAGKLYVQLAWRDRTRDAAILQPVPDSPPETRFLKSQTEADDRFFDAAAVMVPLQSSGDLNPSLQMGDASHPVRIYYWNSSRGAMLMEAHGRGTTKRTGQAYPARGAYQNGRWIVTIELPAQPAGTPVAFAVWNGSQEDRDGRKYFSVWYVLE
jgi:hypothetical protein